MTKAIWVDDDLKKEIKLDSVRNGITEGKFLDLIYNFWKKSKEVGDGSKK